MLDSSQQKWANHLHETIQQAYQRVVIDCQGDADECYAFALELVKPLSYRVISDNASLSDAIPFNKTIQLLGQECNAIIFDAFSGFDVDAFVRVAGLVQAPGLLVIIRPQDKPWLSQLDKRNTWQDQQSGHNHFISYLLKHLVASASVINCQPKTNPALSDLALATKTLIDSTSLLSADQEKAGQVLKKCLQCDESNSFSVALIAPRGRGKSTLIGHCLRHYVLPHQSWIITSDSKQATAHCLNYVRDNKQVDYCALDALLQQQVKADGIIVDEAATIPIALLQQLKKHYRKVIYLSTNDGYEGTGSGFELQFLSTFSQSNLKIISLQQPIRWGDGDLLEHWLNDTFLLKPMLQKQSFKQQDIQYQVINQQSLISDKALLSSLLHLLQVAHYRTQVSDLRALMDNPDLKLLIAHSGDLLVGALVLSAEGGLDSELCQQIHFGKRRPLGHLLPQVLTAHAGSPSFAQLKGYRIQRIAVTKDYRKQGIGSALVRHAKDYAEQQQASYLGAVFALDEQRIEFWKSNQFELMYVSVGQGVSSGKPALSVLIGLDKAAKTAAKQLQNDLQQEWPQRLLSHFKSLPALSVLALFSLMPALGENTQKQCAAYVLGHKGFDHALPKLRQYVLYLLTQHSTFCTQQQQLLLIEAVLQYQPWLELIEQYQLSGKKQLNQQLKAILKPLYANSSVV